MHGLRDYALLLALACCWSSTYPLTKIGLHVDPADHLHLGAFAGCGNLSAGDPADSRHQAADRLLQAWKMFAFQQTHQLDDSRS